jgi:hypothetical protein
MVITSFSPESAINTGQVIITLHGTGFQSEQISNILLDQSVTKRYTCSKIVVRSDTELAVTFSLISIEPGPYTIVIKTTKPASYASQMQFKVLFATSPHVVSISPGIVIWGRTFSVCNRKRIHVRMYGRDGKQGR